MIETAEARRKRMRMRAGRRGIREMDLILGRFAAERLQAMDAGTLELFDALLSENDRDLYAWITGQAAPPARFAALIATISAHSGARSCEF